MTVSDVALTLPEPDAKAIATYLGLNWSDPRTHAVIAVCQRYGFDPVLKHVIVIPKGGAYITRDGLLHVAHRSGQLDGIVLEDQGLDDGEYWAVVSVYRKDMSHPFKYKGRYPLSGSNKQYGPEMAIKCAEAMALRRAFDVTALPILEEHHSDDEAPARVNTARLHPAPVADVPEVEAIPDDNVLAYDEADYADVVEP